MTRYLLSILLGLAPLGLAGLLLYRLGRTIPVNRRRAAIVGALGTGLGGAAAYVEHVVLGVTGLAIDVETAGAVGSLLAMFLFVAPFQEGLQVLVVWPLYRAGHLDSRRLGMAFAATAAAGFTAAESVARMVWSDGSGLVVARILLTVPAHLFCAGVWGYALGSQHRGRWFSTAWAGAVLLHGLYDHIVLGRGPGLLVAALPLLATMGVLAWMTLKDVAPRPRLSDAPPPSAVLAGLEPPSLRAMQRAMQRADRPLMLHWVVIGALVTLGVVLVSLAMAVYAGHRIGIDFALANEVDTRAVGPLALLGSAVLVAFPFAGFLVARASAAHSVLEPALAAAVAIAAVVAMLSVTGAVALVAAIAVAPLAFGLACGGAWFGMER